MKKIAKTISTILNMATLCAIVGVAAFHWNTAQAAERLKQFSEADYHCLQQNIYFEARNQSVLGQRAVAWVTLNRMTDERYPDTICGVVWQDRQFSWTHDGKPDRPLANEQSDWDRAGFIARSVVRQWAHEQESPVADADHYHADYVAPAWARSGERVAQVDNHIFYVIKW